MVGKYYIRVKNKRVEFNVAVERRVSLIKGNSATGKTTFIIMLNQYLQMGKSSGVHCSSNATNLLVFDNNTDYSYMLNKYANSNTIIVIDENVSYVKDKHFCNCLFDSGCYLILISRDSYSGYLEYSVNDIYEFSSNRKDSYTSVKAVNLYNDIDVFLKPFSIITEDSNSGHDIISHIMKCNVISSNGKDNIFNTLDTLNNGELFKGKLFYVIVDGAAFGSRIERLQSWILSDSCNIQVFVYAPESFEWLLLNTKVFYKYVQSKLETPYMYADSKKYKTWENYFEDLLREECQSKYGVSYRKEKWGKLDKLFKSDSMLSDVSALFKDIDDSIKNY